MRREAARVALFLHVFFVLVTQYNRINLTETHTLNATTGTYVLTVTWENSPTIVVSKYKLTLSMKEEMTLDPVDIISGRTYMYRKTNGYVFEYEIVANRFYQVTVRYYLLIYLINYCLIDLG